MQSKDYLRFYSEERPRDRYGCKTPSEVRQEAFRKCRHHPHPILDILPVYLTRGISIAGGLLFRTSPFLRWEKLRCTQRAKAHKKTGARLLYELPRPGFFLIVDTIISYQMF